MIKRAKIFSVRVPLTIQSADCPTTVYVVRGRCKTFYLKINWKRKKLKEE
jgi:hypothetical protein